MPELPEVETIRAGLAPVVVGATIASVDVFRASCVRHQAGGVGEFAMHVTGRTITAAVRRGKFLWLSLGDADGAVDEPQEALSVHLGMSGQFRVAQGLPAAPHGHCRARLTLSTAVGTTTLDFVDQRTFGYLRVEPLELTADGMHGGRGSDDARVPASVSHIARDALDPAVDDAEVLHKMRRGRRGVKQVLLDQTVVSGIGNIYADEALWLARIHPERPADSLSLPEAAALLAAAREVMTLALGQGGTSFDALYVNVNGESGYFSRDLTAYGRGGQPCDRCGRPLERTRVSGRSSHWCPGCQFPHAPGRV